MSFLLKQGADRSIKDDQGRTPGALANEWGFEEVSKLLGFKPTASANSAGGGLPPRSGGLPPPPTISLAPSAAKKSQPTPPAKSTQAATQIAPKQPQASTPATAAAISGSIKPTLASLEPHTLAPRQLVNFFAGSRLDRKVSHLDSPLWVVIRLRVKRVVFGLIFSFRSHMYGKTKHT